jgi:hypothetical protein
MALASGGKSYPFQPVLQKKPAGTRALAGTRKDAAPACPRRFHSIGTPLDCAKHLEVSLGAFDRFADWRRASELALIEFLDGLLNVADTLLHFPGNLL